MQKSLYIIFGWFFVVLGAIGAVLPLLPTTPFLILALALFSKSSPRFHQMLLRNKWFGAHLRQWEQTKTVSRPVKYRAIGLMIVTFSISLYVLRDKPSVQIGLLLFAMIMIFYIWRLKEFPDDK